MFASFYDVVMESLDSLIGPAAILAIVPFLQLFLPSAH